MIPAPGSFPVKHLEFRRELVSVNKMFVVKIGFKYNYLYMIIIVCVRAYVREERETGCVLKDG